MAIACQPLLLDANFRSAHTCCNATLHLQPSLAPSEIVSTWVDRELERGMSPHGIDGERQWSTTCAHPLFSSVVCSLFACSHSNHASSARFSTLSSWGIFSPHLIWYPQVPASLISLRIEAFDWFDQRLKMRCSGVLVSFVHEDVWYQASGLTVSGIREENCLCKGGRRGASSSMNGHGESGVSRAGRARVLHSCGCSWFGAVFV